MRRFHELKTWPAYFKAVGAGRKTFEVRRADKIFGTGDYVQLREWYPKTERYSGRVILVRLTYVMRGGRFGLDPGYCAFSFRIHGQWTDPSLAAKRVSPGEQRGGTGGGR